DERRDREHGRGYRLPDEDRQIALAYCERATELLLSKRTEDHADEDRRHRNVVAPHQESDHADRIEQREIEPRVAQPVSAERREDQDARVGEQTCNIEQL